MEKRGKGAEIGYALTDSALGRMLVARTGAGLCAVAFGDTDVALVEELRQRYPEAALSPAPDGLKAEVEQVLAHFGPEPSPGLPAVDLCGTSFEQSVWAAMREIPRGATLEYGQFAAGLGRPDAHRAVGAAVGKNPLAVLYPCHRLVARGGHLHRYRWGAERKQQLLAMEGARVLVGRFGEADGQGELPFRV